jgi:hypothetical protein
MAEWSGAKAKVVADRMRLYAQTIERGGCTDFTLEEKLVEGSLKAQDDFDLYKKFSLSENAKREITIRFTLSLTKKERLLYA